MSVNQMYDKVDVYIRGDGKVFIVQPDQWATDGKDPYVGAIDLGIDIYPNKRIFIPVSLVVFPGMNKQAILESIKDSILGR